MRYSTKKLAWGGLLIALVTIGTMVIKIPLPAANGYIHIGDSMIYLIGILFGPTLGAVAAGIGSGLADLFNGYVHWALPTLLIKSLEGLIVGKIAQQQKDKTSLAKRDWLAMVTGGGWMIIGYYLAASIIFLINWKEVLNLAPQNINQALTIIQSGLISALGNISGNIIQAVGGIVIAVPLVYALLKTNLLEIFTD